MIVGEGDDAPLGGGGGADGFLVAVVGEEEACGLVEQTDGTLGIVLEGEGEGLGDIVGLHADALVSLDVGDVEPVADVLYVVLSGGGGRHEQPPLGGLRCGVGGGALWPRGKVGEGVALVDSHVEGVGVFRIDGHACLFIGEHGVDGFVEEHGPLPVGVAALVGTADCCGGVVVERLQLAQGKGEDAAHCASCGIAEVEERLSISERCLEGGELLALGACLGGGGYAALGAVGTDGDDAEEAVLTGCRKGELKAVGKVDEFAGNAVVDAEAYSSVAVLDGDGVARAAVDVALGMHRGEEEIGVEPYVATLPRAEVVGEAVALTAVGAWDGTNTVVDELDGGCLGVAAGVSDEGIDVALGGGEEVARLARLHLLVGHEETIDAEEVGEVHLCHVAAVAREEEHIVGSRHLFLVAPSDGEGCGAHGLEDTGPEGGVDAALVEVEVELPVEAQEVVVGALGPRRVEGVLVPHGGVDGSARKVLADFPYNEILEDAVATLGAAHDVDSALVHVSVLMCGAEAKVGVGDDCAEVENFVGDVNVVLGAVPGGSHVSVVVVEGDGAGHVVALLGHVVLDAHDVVLPVEHVLPPVDGIVDAAGAVFAHDAGVHVVHHLLALDVDDGGCGVGKDVDPVGIGVLGHVPEAVDGAVLDVYADGRIVSDELGAVGRGGTNVLNVAHSMVGSGCKHVEPLVEVDDGALQVGALYELKLECRARGYVVAHEDKDDVARVAVDARGIVDTSPAGGEQHSVPVVGVTVGFVAAYAKFSLAVLPGIVLYLESHLHEDVRQIAHSAT